MSIKSSIEWTDATWNPVRGCTKVSPGCAHCYACTFAERFRGVTGHPFEQGFDLRLVPEKLLEPLRWGTPRKVFVNSMADLFHEAIPDDYICAVADVMLTASWHTFQVLTKRADRMTRMLAKKLKVAAQAQHIFWGVTVENQRHGLPRLELLRSSTAARKFISAEPLLEDLGTVDFTGIDWVIVGGESGAGARPIDPSWVRSLRDQCRSACVPFLFKQWGGVRKKDNGRELDGQIYDEYPAALPSLVPSRHERSELQADASFRIQDYVDESLLSFSADQNGGESTGL